MNDGEPTVSAGKFAFQSARAGAVAGLLVVAGLLSLPLSAAIDRRDAGSDRRPAVIDRNFASVVAVNNDDTLEAADAPAVVLAQDVPQEPASPHESGGEPDQAQDQTPWRGRELGIMDRVQDWLARANRQFQTVIVRRLSVAPAGGGGDDIARKIEEVKQEDIDAQARRAEEARRAAEAEQAAEAKHRQDVADAARQKAEEEKRLEDARLAAEAQRAQQQAAEEKKAAEDAAAQEAEQRHQRELAAEAQKAAEDAERLAEQQEAARIAAAKDAEEKAKAQAAQEAAEKERIAREEAAREAAAKEAAAAQDAENTKRVAAEQEAARIAAAKEAEDKAAREAAAREAAAKEAAAREAAEKQRIADAEAAKAAAVSEAKEMAKAVVPPPPSPPETKAAATPPRPHQAQLVREATNHIARGPVVKRWIRRARQGRCRYAGRKILLPGLYVVAPGDTLWRIALRHYRSGLYFMRIYRTNRDLIRNPNRIYPCERLYLPRKRG